MGLGDGTLLDIDMLDMEIELNDYIVAWLALINHRTTNLVCPTQFNSAQLNSCAKVSIHQIDVLASRGMYYRKHSRL